ncbi:MAG: DivIVA domain-containing protein [Lachnospiraceae bacterium]|nr:DivIVA domain-containing protein [Lachnospiraceae bacterium]
MLTPVEVQSKVFKSGGLGYDKKDVENFRAEVLHSYEDIYRENMELKDKLSVLNEGIQYYKTIEKTLQKALILAEKTAEETRSNAAKEAKRIEQEARTKASIIVADARNELSSLNKQSKELIRQYEKYRAEFKHLASAQVELISSKAFDLDIKNFEINDEVAKTEFSASDESSDKGTDKDISFETQSDATPIKKAVNRESLKPSIIKKQKVSVQEAADLSKSDDGIEEDFGSEDFDTENEDFSFVDFQEND